LPLLLLLLIHYAVVIAGSCWLNEAAVALRHAASATCCFIKKTC
jgi:hypothetical protein